MWKVVYLIAVTLLIETSYQQGINPSVLDSPEYPEYEDLRENFIEIIKHYNESQDDYEKTNHSQSRILDQLNSRDLLAYVKQWSVFDVNENSVKPTDEPGKIVEDEQSLSITPFDQSKCPPCSCGALGKESRIVGGKPTYFNKYPWIAMLLFDGTFHCGGTVINNKYVITAAHCVQGYKKKEIIVRLLEYDRRSVTDKIALHIELNVSRIITHELFNPDFNYNDIALLRLDTEGIEFGLRTGIIPVCMPVKDENYVGYEGIVTGWGKESENSISSSVLREVNVPIISNNDCRNTAYGADLISESMMCAGYTEGQKDACNGDSGGPLHIAIHSVYYIVGVVSWGHGCAQPNRPGVYTKVNSYLDWIVKFTADACSCTNIYTASIKST